MVLYYPQYFIILKKFFKESTNFLLLHLSYQLLNKYLYSE